MARVDVRERAWTEEELAIMRAGREAGEGPTVIASRLIGRTKNSVVGKLSRMTERSELPEPRPRAAAETRRGIPRPSGPTLPPLPSQRKEA